VCAARSRHLIAAGEFGSLVDDSCVSGATSNPTIFAAAIRGADGYDQQLQALLGAGARDAQTIFFDLALDDVRNAADLLRGVYDQSGGRDGFVSFECTPDLADGTDATIEQAQMLWARLERPNVMIKVPATAAGIGAIEELTAGGVNVNITLLFARSRYDEVIEAYLTGLERRAAAGDSVDTVSSVASFSCRGWTPRPTSNFPKPRRFGAGSRSPTPSSPISSTSVASPMTAGTLSPLGALAPSGRCGPVPVRRIRRIRT
jgi:transaldolase